MSRQTGAAVESFRNEMVDANRSSQDLLMAATEMSTGAKLIDLRK
jgi:hypothetical protein